VLAEWVRVPLDAGRLPVSGGLFEAVDNRFGQCPWGARRPAVLADGLGQCRPHGQPGWLACSVWVGLSKGVEASAEFGWRQATQAYSLALGLVWGERPTFDQVLASVAEAHGLL
jgi:hypothetical protein